MQGSIDRETLYDEVWRMPMIEVGKKYGLSRPTIKWACQELGVPLPPHPRPQAKKNPPASKGNCRV